MKVLDYNKRESLLKWGILTLAGILAFSTRLFSVLRFESVIHEFDPYFNYRTTKFLTEQGKSGSSHRVPRHFIYQTFFQAFTTSTIGLMIELGIHWAVLSVEQFTPD